MGQVPERRCALIHVHYSQPAKKTLVAFGDFVWAYQQVFAGPPYFEKHTKKDVQREVWSPHYGRGIIVLAYGNRKIAGFGCAIPLNDPLPAEVLERLRSYGFLERPELTWYMSELGVLDSYRGQGIGSELVLRRLKLIRSRGGTHYCLQTARIGSHSESLYLSIGASVLGEDEQEQSKYLAGRCDEAIAKLQERL